MDFYRINNKGSVILLTNVIRYLLKIQKIQIIDNFYVKRITRQNYKTKFSFYKIKLQDKISILNLLSSALNISQIIKPNDMNKIA